MTSSIAKILESRGAWLRGAANDERVPRARAGLTRRIADNYSLFEQVRDRVFQNTEAFMRHTEIIPDILSPEGHELVAELLANGLVKREDHGHEICELQGRRYLSGGWLEELAWLAAYSAGVDEAVYSQNVGWNVKGYTGENEIDLILRRNDQLAFVSCKALRSNIDMQDRKHRNRLMDAVHEADNIADHFGSRGEKVAVLVTTDLFDEIKNSPRYNALMGKAAILDVRVIALEELGWDKLVGALAELLQ
jgi:hypothetical protein